MIRRNFLKAAVAGVIAAITAPTSLLARPIESDHELLKKIFAKAPDLTYITYYNKWCCVTKLASHDIPKEIQILSDRERQRLRNTIAIVDRNHPNNTDMYSIPNVKWDSIDAHIAYAKKHNDTKVLEWLAKTAYKTSCDLCGKKLQMNEVEETGSFGPTGYMCRGGCQHDNVHTIKYSFS